MAIKCILFDADGVVIKTERFSKQYQEKFGVDSKEMDEFFKGVFQNSVLGINDLKVIVKPWLSKWKWDKSVDEFLEFWFESENKPDEKMIVKVKELVKDGIICAIATNQESYRTHFMWNDMGFNHIFHHIFPSSSIGAKKDETRFFEFVLSKLHYRYGFKPEEILYFDDSEIAVETAKKVGIESYLYKGYDDFLKVVYDKL